MSSTSIVCPKCGSRLGVPNPAPDRIACGQCRAVIKIGHSHADASKPTAPPAPPPARVVSQVKVLPPETSAVKKVAGYELQRELARGGLGVVYLAFHRGLKHQRAIKRPQPRADIDNDVLLARFVRECEALGAMDSKHIIRAYDAGSDADGPYLVMEYLDGESLSSLVSRHRQLPIAEACELIRQAALGLQAAHETGSVHRDIKPSNLMLARASAGTARVTVIDWGLVKRLDEAAAPAHRLTKIHSELGTPDFISPEQIRDAHSVDRRADIYSLGVTLYFLLAGRAPFQGRSDEQKLVAQGREEFPPLEQLRGDIPKALLRILQKMVNKDPAQRYASAAEVAAALQPFACAEPHRIAGLLAPVSAATASPPDTGGILNEQTQLAPPKTPTPPSNPVQPQSSGLILWLIGGTSLFVALSACIIATVVVVGWKGNDKKDVSKTDVLVPKDKKIDPETSNSFMPPPGPVLKAEEGTPHKMRFTNGGDPSHCVAFMPDGKRGLVRHNYGYHVRVFDLVDGVARPTEPIKPIFSDERLLPIIVVSPDGKRFLVPTGSTVPRRNGETFEAENPPIGLTGQCTAVAFSPDSKVVATAERDGDGAVIRFWGAKERTPLHKEIRLKSPVIGLSFSPDGQSVAASSGGLSAMALVNSSKEKILIYRCGDDEPTMTLPGHEKSASWAGFFADGKRLFSVSPYDGTLRVWNIEGKSARELTEKRIQAGKNATGLTAVNDAKHPEYMVHGAFWPWGRALTAHRDGSLKLWDLDTGKLIEPPGRIDSLSDQAQKSPTAMAISPDGHYALVAYNDDHLYLIRLPPPRLVKNP